MEHFIELLNVQTDSEDITENNYPTKNCNIPEKIEVKFGNIEEANAK
jgi:hypothetical protein